MRRHKGKFEISFVPLEAGSDKEKRDHKLAACRTHFNTYRQLCNCKFVAKQKNKNELKGSTVKHYVYDAVNSNEGHSSSCDGKSNLTKNAIKAKVQCRPQLLLKAGSTREEVDIRSGQAANFVSASAKRKNIALKEERDDVCRNNDAIWGRLIEYFIEIALKNPDDAYVRLQLDDADTVSITEKSVPSPGRVWRGFIAFKGVIQILEKFGLPLMAVDATFPRSFALYEGCYYIGASELVSTHVIEGWVGFSRHHENKEDYRFMAEMCQNAGFGNFFVRHDHSRVHFISDRDKGSECYT